MCAKPCEEPKLIIVSVRLTPIPMERRNELLGLLDAERIDDRPVPLIDASAFEGSNRPVQGIRSGTGIFSLAAIDDQSSRPQRRI